jgi:hypothetical protein
MYLMYVDESGDVGLVNSPTRFFVLTGLVVRDLRWRSCLDELIFFRRRMRVRFGLKLREEIHSAAMINRPGELARIPRNERLNILRLFALQIATMMDLSVINVVVDKQNKPATYDVFDRAWCALIQRFENTMRYGNFPGPADPNERGMLFPDNTDDRKLTRLTRQMRRYNPVPSSPATGVGFRNLPLNHIIEDPNFRNSEHSYFVQAADLAAFLLYQKLSPNAYIRKKGGQNYFDRLAPILCTRASSNDPHGIVRL